MQFNSRLVSIIKLKLTTVLTILIISTSTKAQTITNGNFTSNSSGWGCSPETRAESVYGGTGGNKVAEVDASAGLCQTVTGFTIGSIYSITFDCTRRTSCGPATQTLDLSIDAAGFTTKSVSRTGSFNLTFESYNFTASATSHFIEFDGTSAGTCGLILDNIAVSLVSALPVELISFEAAVNGDAIDIFWSTASEINNDYFKIENSTDGQNWEEVLIQNGVGNSSSIIEYLDRDTNPKKGKSFYRLIQVDFDGTETIYHVVPINFENSFSSMELYPNPTTTENINLSLEGFKNQEVSMVIRDIQGREFYSKIQTIAEKSHFEILTLVREVPPGIYIVTASSSQKIYSKRLIIK